jgi:hypothetical protein
MKRLGFVALFALVLAGCTTPSTYGDARVMDWKKETIEQKFPDKATTKAQVFAALGKGSETIVGDLTRWEYSAEKSGRLGILLLDTRVEYKKSVIFVFDKNDRLVNKVFEGF